MMQDSTFPRRSRQARSSLALAGLFFLVGCATDGSLPPAPQNAAMQVTPVLEQAVAQLPGAEARAEATLRDASPQRRLVLQNEILTLLARSEMPEAGRLWLIRSLALVAGPESVPALVSLCGDPRWCNGAVDTLVRVPGEQAEVAILRELSDEFCTVRLPLVRVVERRMLQGAVPVLTALTRSEDLALAEAAIRSLGTIGSQGAYQALRALPVRPEFAELRVRALVAALARIAGSRTAPAELRASAMRSCREVLAGNWPAPLRASSLHSLAFFAGAAASPELYAALRGDDAVFRAAAISAIVDARYSDLSSVIASGCSSLPLPVHQALLEAFAAASDPVAKDLAFAALSHSDPSLRATGVRVLTSLCKASEVPRLLRLVEAQGDNASEAATIISRLTDPQVDVLLRERLGGAAPALAAVLLELSATRGDRAVFEPAYIALESGLAAEPSLRGSALEALRLLSVPADTERLLALLYRLEDVSDIRILAQTLRGLAPRHPEPSALAALLLQRLSGPNPGPERLRALRGGIAGLDTPASSAYFATVLARPGSEDWREGVRLLSASGQFAHANALLEAARAASGADRDLAVRGLVFLCSQPSSATVAQRSRCLESLRSLAANPAEREAVETALQGLRPKPRP